jgi:acetyl esterase
MALRFPRGHRGIVVVEAETVTGYASQRRSRCRAIIRAACGYGQLSTASRPSERCTTLATPEEDPRGTLHPQVQTLFDVMLAARPAERVIEAEAMQAADELIAAMLNIGAPASPAPAELQIPGPAGSIRALVFTPENPSGRPMPVLLFIHGGGFVIMNPETHAKLTKLLAIGSGAIVVSIDYRRAPQHPYPAPLDDCVAAFRWVREQAASLGGDPARVAVAGDSAGGNLTAATVLRLLAEGDAAPAAAMLICAWTDLSNATPAFDLFAPDDPVIDTLVMDLFRASYAPEPAQWDDPFVSPLRGDLSAFPPACVVIGGIDPLRDDGVRFAQKLRVAGREVDEQFYEGMPHDFMMWVPTLHTAQPSIDAMCSFLRHALA